jgi:hypothetical protein
VEKKFGPIFKELYNFLPKKLSLRSPKYVFGIRDQRSRIQKKSIPDPGSWPRSQKGTGSQILDPGSATLQMCRYFVKKSGFRLFRYRLNLRTKSWNISIRIFFRRYEAASLLYAPSFGHSFWVFYSSFQSPSLQTDTYSDKILDRTCRKTCSRSTYSTCSTWYLKILLWT